MLKIIIETVFNAGPYRQLRFRKDMLHGLCQHMGCRMAHNGKSFLVSRRQDGKLAVLRQRCAQVAHYAVNPTGTGRLV